MTATFRVCALAALGSTLATGCGRFGGSSFTPSAGSGITSQGARDGAASTIKAWAIGLSDRCPSKKETIAVTVGALDANYNLIGGAFSPPMKLSDTDKSGATQLSTTTVTRASQKIKLTYSGAKIKTFSIIPSVGGHKGTGLTITPDGKCINAKPSLIGVSTVGKGTVVRLSGNAKPPFIMRALDPLTGLGCNKFVQIGKLSGTSYKIEPPAHPAYGACAVYAVSKGDYFQINVLLIR
jgi:hypothetical protein